MKKKRKKKKSTGPAPAAAPVHQGRKTLLTQELIREISSKVAACASFKDACITSGVSEDSGFTWLQKGGVDGADPIYRQFSESIDGAKARRRTALKLEIRRAAQGTPKKPGDWRAASALGAITDPEDFVPQVRVHIASQLDDALDRLKEAFHDDPEAYERAVHAIAGGARRSPNQLDAKQPGGEDAAGGEAVHPTPAVPKAEGVP